MHGVATPRGFDTAGYACLLNRLVEEARSAQSCTFDESDGMLTFVTNVPVRTIADMGAGVRGCRLEKGWTQAELAARAGVSRRWVITLEKGQVSGVELSKVLRVLTVLSAELRLGPAPAPSAEELAVARLYEGRRW